VTPRAGWRPVVRVVATIAAMLATPLVAGPVEVYREGAQYCPRDRRDDAPVLTEADAIARARALLPAEACAPSRFVDGCEALPEFSLGTWRIYLHQYKLRDGRHDWGGLTHSYVILDRVGNCHANIPGTEVGAPR
jgi:hypothetical protein